MVLRTSVTYRTQRNSLTLSDEQRQQSDQLQPRPNRPTAMASFGEAIRSYYHGMAVMRGVSWTPAFEFASPARAAGPCAGSPGDKVTVTLSPSSSLVPDGVKMSAAWRWCSGQERASREESWLERRASIRRPPRATRITVPADAWRLHARSGLRAEGERLPAARAGLVKTLPVHIEALAADARKLRDRLSKIGQKSSTSLPSAEYVLDFYDRADRGDVNPGVFHFRDEFAKASEILDAIEAGKDPFAGKHGDFRKAYLSAVDHTLQPYRILVPEVYNGTGPSALVVVLHGMGGDENSMFDSYGGAFKPAAEKAGFIAVCPKGRDSASMYRGSAEQDVLDVLAEVRRDYKIDANRIYLMGHRWVDTAPEYRDGSSEIFAPSVPSRRRQCGGMAKIAKIPEYGVTA